MSAAAEEAEQARALGARADELTAEEVRRLFPGLCCDLAGAYLFPDDGHLDPLRFTTAVAELAADAGAEVVTGAEVLSLESAPEGVRAVTTRGDFAAGQVVLAAGAWSPILARGLGLAPADRAGQGLQRRCRAAEGLPRDAALPGRRPRRPDPPR